jgi:hypothetical protein
MYSYRLCHLNFFYLRPANRSVSLRSSAALVSVQLAQVWQHPSDGFRRSVRLF